MIITQYRCPLTGDLEFRLAKYDRISGMVALFKNKVEKNRVPIINIRKALNSKLIRGIL